MYFTHLSGIAHYPESAYPRPITVFKSSGPRSSFFRSFAICTSIVRVWIGTVIFHADANRKFREQMCPEWSSSVMNSWYSVVVRWMRQPCLWTEKSLSSIPSYKFNVAWLSYGHKERFPFVLTEEPQLKQAATANTRLPQVNTTTCAASPFNCTSRAVGHKANHYVKK